LRILYLFAVYLTAPIISAVLLWRGLRDRSYWHNFGERFGLGARRPPHGVWVHAVSVGEVQACAPLVSALYRRHPDVPLTVTTFTPTGAARARALFGNMAEVRYVPYDLPGAVRRFFRRVQPRLAVIFETELWPNLYRECGRRRVPLVLASARIAARSLGRYRRLGALFSDALSQAAIVAAQGEADAERFRALGAAPDNTHVTGNLKFDFELPPDIAERGQRVRAQYAAQRPLWVAGSTHGGGEETALLEAQRQVLSAHGDALLVIAPRHPARFDEVAQQLSEAGMRFVRRSDPDRTRGRQEPQVLLLDSLGELLEFYAAADLAFVGGSLVPMGGHNVLEAAQRRRPVLTGPYTSNFREAVGLLESVGAALVARDASELSRELRRLLADPELRSKLGDAGYEAVTSRQGAVRETLDLIGRYLYPGARV